MLAKNWTLCGTLGIWTASLNISWVSFLYNCCLRFKLYSQVETSCVFAAKLTCGTCKSVSWVSCSLGCPPLVILQAFEFMQRPLPCIQPTVIIFTKLYYNLVKRVKNNDNWYTFDIVDAVTVDQPLSWRNFFCSVFVMLWPMNSEMEMLFVILIYLFDLLFRLWLTGQILLFRSEITRYFSSPEIERQP